MNSKITIPIVIAISVIVTAGRMVSVGYDNQPQITQSPQTEIIYIDKTASDIFEGTNNVKKISSQEELKNILETSSLLGGNFYNGGVMGNRGSVNFAFSEDSMEMAMPTMEA